MIAPATSGTTVTPTGKPTPRSSRYCMTPQTDASPKALPPASTTPWVVGARWRVSRNSMPYTPAARPRTSTAPTAGRSGRIAVQPVSPTASVAWPTRGPGAPPGRGGRAAPCRLAERSRPSPARGPGEGLLDGPVPDGGLALGLDLIGHHEPAVLHRAYRTKLLAARRRRVLDSPHDTARRRVDGDDGGGRARLGSHPAAAPVVPDRRGTRARGARGRALGQVGGEPHGDAAAPGRAEGRVRGGRDAAVEVDPGRPARDASRAASRDAARRAGGRALPARRGGGAGGQGRRREARGHEALRAPRHHH